MNTARGEKAAILAGERVTLCLTLGALAEIEDGLGVEGLDGLAERLRRLTAGDLGKVLTALLVGGGAERAGAERLATMSEPRAAVAAVVAAFEAAAR